jgi:hypothetical protein
MSPTQQLIVKRIKEGRAEDEILRELRISRDYFREVRRKHGLSTPRGRRWKDWEVASLWCLAGIGASSRRIAATLTELFGREISRNSVCGQAHRQGIRLGRAGPCESPYPRLN